MRQPPDIIQRWIIAIREEGRGVTKWEEDFVDSIAEKFAERGSLSEKEEAILERIYANRTP